MAHHADRFGLTTGITAPLIAPASMGRYGMHGGMGIVDPVTVSVGAGVLGELDKQLGIADSFTGGLKAEEAQPAIGKKISEAMNSITRDLLGFDGDSQQERRVFFRLGEILAKADPKVAAKGWAYAGYGNNTVNAAKQEGSDFRTATNRSGKILGLEGHLQPETVFGVRVEVGKQGELLSIYKSVLETVTRFKVAFAAIPDQTKRRAVFAGCCQKWLASGWKTGLDFLPAPQPPDAAFMAILTAPRGSSKGAGITGGDIPTPPSSIGSGAIVAGIAALAGIYLLSKS